MKLNENKIKTIFSNKKLYKCTKTLLYWINLINNNNFSNGYQHTQILILIYSQRKKLNKIKFNYLYEPKKVKIIKLNEKYSKQH